MFTIPSFGMVFTAILLVIGIAWCAAIAKRFPGDLAELRESDDKINKVVIVIFWLITLLVAIAVVRFIIPVIANIIEGVRSLL